MATLGRGLPRIVCVRLGSARQLAGLNVVRPLPPPVPDGVGSRALPCAQRPRWLPARWRARTGHRTGVREVIAGGFEIRCPAARVEETMGSYRTFLAQRFTASAPTGLVVLHRLLLILIVLSALAWVQGAWAGPPTEQLRDGVDRVVKVLTDPELRGDTKVNERNAAVNKVADDIFDFGETAKRALGQHSAQT